jgi:hypothetical protein
MVEREQSKGRGTVIMNSDRARGPFTLVTRIARDGNVSLKIAQKGSVASQMGPS